MGLRHGNRSTRHQQVVKLQLQSHGGEKAHELAEDRDARHTRRMRDVHLHPPAAITKPIITTSPYHSVQLVKKPIPHAMVGRLPALPHRLQHLQQPRIQSRRQAAVEVKATGSTNSGSSLNIHLLDNQAAMASAGALLPWPGGGNTSTGRVPLGAPSASAVSPSPWPRLPAAGGAAEAAMRKARTVARG
eukprot:CAMPEP_0177479882 /NCGR_PEP_ID=MMETSP0369-20130122/25501_1 /TAXON_ID=447022 ORGANISM="Scrippsiella hangoei-like, Strain SHHI-4" /NCGR_SAMPLE_ID=MMETSP0369 /ASSEMBLY_ACC=CAM_ASM_000364 /LENGTH=188 /DNA_ID=CAMNT_0018955497 /DNA_START=112 /DNA_END=675 /DNA_ORIENTATION=-